MSEKTRIPLTAPWMEKDEILKVTEVLESGNLSTGWQVEQLEREIAEYIGCKHAVCLSSATAALHLAFIVAGIGPGDEVIVPAFTFPGAAQIPHLLGAKTVFADCEYSSYAISPAAAAEAVTDKTKAIMPVSAFGLPYDLEQIRALADKHNLIVIGDNAGAFGSKYEDLRLGAAECDLHNPDGTNRQDKELHNIRGKAEDLSCFSFHPTKILTTGEGGCVCTENSDWAVQIRMLRDHGSITRSEPEPKKRFVTIGFRYVMSDVHAAIGRVQLSKINEMIMRRREAAGIYTELLEQLNPTQTIKSFKSGVGDIPLPEKKYNIVTPYETTGAYHTYQRYVIYLTYHDGISVRNQLRKQGIEATFGYYNAADEPFAERLGIYKRCPITNKLFRHTIALPLYHTISKEDQEHVVATLKTILKV